jgi:DNA-binding response OmpR family regulator
MPLDTSDRLKVLAVDDSRSSLLLLKALLSEYGHEVVIAADGLEAIAAFEQEQPDVILMDVMMPRLDGIEAARRIRAANPTVPILFLSANTEAHSVEQALQLGTDYITKPIQQQQLSDKLNAHFRTVLANRALVRQQKELQQLHDQQLEETRVAAELFSRVLTLNSPPSELCQYSIIPSDIFSGDMVLSSRTPSGRLHVILCDAIGHGLPAALTLLPVIRPFIGMSARGYPLSDILFELNNTLQAVLPAGRFIAATAVALDPASGQAEVWVGGNPAVLVRTADHHLHRIPSSHLALGIVNFRDRSEFFGERLVLAAEDRLVLYSDGLAESWREGRLEDYIRTVPRSEIFSRVQTLAQDLQGHDDTSLVVLRMGTPLGPAAAPTPPLTASLQLSFDAAQLKQPELLERIGAAAWQLGPVAVDDTPFQMVLAELFSNALEHGILGLSSELKEQGAAGFATYFEQREQRLATLEHARLQIDIAASEFSGQPATRLRIVDSGPGFDVATLDRLKTLPEDALCGRGIRLLASLCLHVAHTGNGNEVTVYVPRARPAPAADDAAPAYLAAHL